MKVKSKPSIDPRRTTKDQGQEEGVRRRLMLVQDEGVLASVPSNFLHELEPNDAH